MGFALALAARFLSERPSAGLDRSARVSRLTRRARSTGRASSRTGSPSSRLVFVDAPDANAAFWAMEEALKCGAPAAVVGEIWSLKGYSLAASRRLLLAARKGRTPALLVLAERLWPGGADVQRRRDAVRDRRRAERARFRRRAAATCPAPSPAGRGSSRRASGFRARRAAPTGDRRGAASCGSNGEARTRVALTRS